MPSNLVNSDLVVERRPLACSLFSHPTSLGFPLLRDDSIIADELAMLHLFCELLTDLGLEISRIIIADCIIAMATFFQLLELKCKELGPLPELKPLYAAGFRGARENSHFVLEKAARKLRYVTSRLLAEI